MGRAGRPEAEPWRSEIQSQIDAVIGQIQARLEAHADEIDRLQSRIDTRQRNLRVAIDELEIDLALHGRAADRVSLGQLDHQMRGLTRDAAHARSLAREVTGFIQLLTSSRQQFRAEGVLPGVDDGQRLAIRQAAIQAEEDERRRLAREIHDGPAQVLANAILGLEFISRTLQQPNPEAGALAATEIDTVKAAMREGLTEIRRFMFDLRPTMLSEWGLIETIEHYVRAYGQLFRGEVELDLAADLPPLTPEQEQTTFRVMQEALQNVHRHARSTKTWITLAPEPDYLVLTVRDNGQGFQPEGVRATAMSGAGLGGMRERAEVIGGQLEVRSAPGIGTEVSLRIPLGEQQADVRPARDRDDGKPVSTRSEILPIDETDCPAP